MLLTFGQSQGIIVSPASSLNAMLTITIWLNSKHRLQIYRNIKLLLNQAIQIEVTCWFFNFLNFCFPNTCLSLDLFIQCDCCITVYAYIKLLVVFILDALKSVLFRASLAHFEEPGASVWGKRQLLQHDVLRHAHFLPKIHLYIWT